MSDALEEKVADAITQASCWGNPGEMARAAIAAIASALLSATEEVERLRAALVRHGVHDDACNEVMWCGMPGHHCDCGFGEILASLPEPPEAR